MNGPPETVARAKLLRNLPRVLRAGLGPHGRRGDIVPELVLELETLAPDVGTAVRTWMEQGCPLEAEPHRSGPVAAWPGPLRLLRRPRVGGESLTERLVASGARAEVPELREIADALLLLMLPADDLRHAPRLALAVTRATAALNEVAHALHKLALVEAEVLNDRDDSFAWPVDAPRGPVEAGERAAARSAWRACLGQAYDGLKADAHALAAGLALAGVGCVPEDYDFHETLADRALALGRRTAAAAAKNAVGQERRRQARQRADDAQARGSTAQTRPVQAPSFPEQPQPASASPLAGAPEGSVLVCPALPKTGSDKGKEIARGYEHVVGEPLPLVPVFDLPDDRASLLARFPQARAAIDRILGDLAGKRYVRLSPFLLVGPPGSGKSRFARVLGETLGVGVYRVDATGDAGAGFGGTERRWYSAEPCRPLMAVARHRHANPLLLVDELDKAPTRSDHGRIWDSLLQVLEPENAARYPDPAFQVDLDLSWVSVIATANDASRLPGPLLDRLRVVEFPEPGPEHLDALVPMLLADLAHERGLDVRFFPALDAVEREAMRRRWRGGSVRRLRRAVEAVLRVREQRAGEGAH